MITFCPKMSKFQSRLATPDPPCLVSVVGLHGRMARGVQRGFRGFRGAPPTLRRRVGHGRPGDTLGSPWPPLAIRPCGLAHDQSEARKLFEEVGIRILGRLLRL
jgi:hypothetical protein